MALVPLAWLCGASVAEAQTAPTVVDAETPPGYGVSFGEVTSSGRPNAVDEHPERHVFRLERGGVRAGLGAVLSSGRAVSSLTGVGSGRDLVGVFADGRRASLRVLATHRGFDLALLAFVANAPATGLELSDLDQLDRAVLLTAKGAAVRRFEGAAAERAVGGDSVELAGATVPARPLPIGAPVVDTLGRLAGLSIQGCVYAGAAASCRERDLVVRTNLLRQFLQEAGGADSMSWLGAGVELFDAGWLRGLRVVSVELGSPAQAASLEEARPGREGDLLVALNGIPIGTPRRLHEMLSGFVPGMEVDFLLLRNGTFRHVTVRLGAQPRSDDPWQLNPPLIQPPSPWPGF